MIVNPNDIYFSALKDTATIPSKRLEDAGYDIYANFEEDFVIINPHTVKLIPTGIASAFHHSKVAVLKERGSTGTKNMSQKAGIIDSGYRNEWFVPIANDNDRPIVISKLKEEELYQKLMTELRDPVNVIIYPYEKAIAQCLMVEVPVMNVNELPYEELLAISSERGTGALGSSGK